MHVEIGIELAGPAEGVVDAEALRAFVRQALDAEAGRPGLDTPAALALLIGGDERLRELNRLHRGIDEPTDVLSFPAEEGEAFPSPGGGERYLGDIAVSVETVRRQAAEAGLAFEDELRHVVLHGLLHLLGYDHETAEEAAAMRAREEALLGSAIHAGDREHAED